MRVVNKQRQGRRIVVGLKPASHVESPFEAAVTLAAALDAEIFGIFEKEEAMIDLAGLPFASALGIGENRPRQLTRDSMEKALDRRELLCRRTLSVRAERAKVSWSFQTTRGELSDNIKRALAVGDFLVLSREGRGPGSQTLMDEIRSTIEGARGVVITPFHGFLPGKGPVIAIDECGKTGEEAVRLALRIASVTEAQPVLFVIAPSDREASNAARRIELLPGSGSLPIIYRFFPGSPQSIAAALERLAPSFVVADMEGEHFRDDKSARVFLRSSKAPIVLLQGDNPRE